MKLMHLSDLHLGKRVNEFSMIEDQAFILEKILQLVDEETPDGVMIAGDIYDKSVPSAEAVILFDDFLVALSQRQVPVFIISGNHDSPERLAFGNRIMADSGIHIASAFSGQVESVTLMDAFGPVVIRMLPFIKPAHVRPFFPEAEIHSFTDAMKMVIDAMNVDPTQRNILITHQLVTGAGRSDSEEISVGGADNVDAWVFEDFDYVALGHIHGPQNIRFSEKTASEIESGKPGHLDKTMQGPLIRYCGTPLKYSFSEAEQDKSVTMVELGEKGQVDVRTIPLIPYRDLVEIRGTYETLTYRGTYQGTDLQRRYLHIILTDALDIPDAMARLRVIYPYLMKLSYDNLRTRHHGTLTEMGEHERISPQTLFSRFYEEQNGLPLSAQQRDYIHHLIEEIWEDAE